LIIGTKFMKALEAVSMQNGFMGCAICGKPLRLAASKTEGSGLPVHEHCHQLRSEPKQAPSRPQKEAPMPSSALMSR
jgi:ribosome-binding protein aMBF1 (putative translation factor)